MQIVKNYTTIKKERKNNELRRTCNTTKKLSGKVLYMTPRKRCKVVFLQKVVHTHPKKLRNETNVVFVIKVIQ